MKRAILFAACVACSGAAGENHPVATLSASAPASVAFAELREDYEHELHDAAMRLRFERYLSRYPNDATTPLVHLYLGHLAMDHADADTARRELATVREPAHGNTHDFWVALHARLLRFDKKPDEALAEMQPLVGTVVDPPLRATLLEEVALTSMDAHHSFEAVAYLDGWLRAVPAHSHKAAHDGVRAALARIDPSALEQVLSAMKGGDAGGYSTELQRLVAESLAKHAIEAGDTRMAQHLIDSPLGQYLTGTTMGQDLRDLATSLRGARAVAFRTIGLVLPTQTAELRDAAADAARGAAFALGLPRGTKDDDGTRLVTRADAGGGLEAALEELAGAGAAVVLAGFDEATADQACHWAEQNGLAVITMVAPSKETATRFCYVAGEEREKSVTLLLAELEKRIHHHDKVGLVTGVVGEPAISAAKSATLDLLPPYRCEPPYSRSRMPLTEWTEHGVHAFLLAAPGACVRTMIGGLPPGSKIAIGLESLSGAESVPHGGRSQVFVAGAGLVPAAAQTKESQWGDYMKMFAAKPSYWTALGHDAALLGRHAEEALPTNATQVPAEVTHRRDIARAGLLQATAALWTTEASGFANAQRLARTLRIVDLTE